MSDLTGNCLLVLLCALVVAFLLAFLASKLPGPTRRAEIVIDRPVAIVWEIVSSSKHFGEIIQGAWWWGPFEPGTARPGTSFKKGHLLDEKARQWDYYIVHWEPLKRFSMGPTPRRWHFDFQLTKLGEGRTQLACARRFNGLGVLPNAKLFVEQTAQRVAGEADAAAAAGPT